MKKLLLCIIMYQTYFCMEMPFTKKKRLFNPKTKMSLAAFHQQFLKSNPDQKQNPKINASKNIPAVYILYSEYIPYENSPIDWHDWVLTPEENFDINDFTML